MIKLSKEFLNDLVSFPKDTISTLSSSDGLNGKSLVTSPINLFDFDKITKIFFVTNPPASADAMFFDSKRIAFIEFKTGFNRRVTKKNLDPQKMTCPKDGSSCEDYKDLFFKKQKSEINEIIDSIRFKIIESGRFLEFKGSLGISSESKEFSFVFVVVIDVPNTDALDGMMNDLTKKTNSRPTGNNCIAEVGECFCRFRKSDSNGLYLYDEIKVYSSVEFQAICDNKSGCQVLNPAGVAHGI